MEDEIDILNINEKEYLKLKELYDEYKNNKYIFYHSENNKRYTFFNDYLKYVLEYLETKFKLNDKK